MRTCCTTCQYPGVDGNAIEQTYEAFENASEIDFDLFNGFCGIQDPVNDEVCELTGSIGKISAETGEIDLPGE